MTNKSQNSDVHMSNKNELDDNTRKLFVLPSEGGEEDETCQTFVMNREDHTLGNSLRYIIMKNPDTQFCGYSIPHPSEEKINFRIQTYGKPATTVLRQGLKDLNGVCEHVLRTFESSVNEFKRRHQSVTSDVEMVDQSKG